MMAIFAVLWRFKELIALGVCLIVLGGLVARYNYVVNRYEKQKIELAQEREAHENTKKGFAKEVLKWNEQVARVQQERDNAKKFHGDLVKKQRKSFDDLFPQTKKTTDEEIKIVVKPTDTIVVPVSFVCLYQRAVDRANATIAGSVVSESGTCVAGESNTFDATAFTEVVISNVELYAALALRHNTLSDFVVKLEDYHAKNDNPSRPDGVPEDSRGNLSSRIIESLF